MRTSPSRLSPRAGVLASPRLPLPLGQRCLPTLVPPQGLRLPARAALLLHPDHLREAGRLPASPRWVPVHRRPGLPFAASLRLRGQQAPKNFLGKLRGVTRPIWPRVLTRMRGHRWVLSSGTPASVNQRPAPPIHVGRLRPKARSVTSSGVRALSWGLHMEPGCGVPGFMRGRKSKSGAVIGLRMHPGAAGSALSPFPSWSPLEPITVEPGALQYMFEKRPSEGVFLSCFPRCSSGGKPGQLCRSSVANQQIWGPGAWKRVAYVV